MLLDDKFVEHYGTKGMRWGVRKKVGVSSSKMKKILKKKFSSLNKQNVKDGAIATGILVAAIGGVAVLAWAEGGPARSRAKKATAGLKREHEANITKDLNYLFRHKG